MPREKLFPLETVYQSLSDVFSDHLRSEADVIKDGIVFLDANVLLLPYRMDGESYKELMSAYGKLGSKGALKIPAQAVREFVKNRGKVIAEVIKVLRDKKSRIPRVGDTAVMRHFDLDEPFKKIGRGFGAID